MSPKFGRRVMIALAAVFIAIALDRLTTAAPATQPTQPSTEEQLRKKVAEQDLQIAQLQAQLAQKDLLIERLQRRLSMMPQPQPLQPYGWPMVPGPQVPSLRSPVAPPDMPPGSVPRRFNGSTFYLVPVEGQAVPSGEGVTVQGWNSRQTGSGTVVPGSLRNVEIQKSAGPERITVPARPHQDLIDDRPAAPAK